jgi:hypothetical protein
MKVPAFDAVLEFPLGKDGPDFRAEAVFPGKTVASRFTRSSGAIRSKSGPRSAERSAAAPVSFPAPRPPRNSGFRSANLSSSASPSGRGR